VVAFIKKETAFFLANMLAAFEIPNEDSCLKTAAFENSCWKTAVGKQLLDALFPHVSTFFCSHDENESRGHSANDCRGPIRHHFEHVRTSTNWTTLLWPESDPTASAARIRTHDPIAPVSSVAEGSF
jgi:hypothetical protein